eukprot:12904206-Prorocentrum_lima.AAC.1
MAADHKGPDIPGCKAPEHVQPFGLVEICYKRNMTRREIFSQVSFSSSCMEYMAIATMNITLMKMK